MKQSEKAVCVKVAVRREPGYPVGSPAPMFLVCVCGSKVAIDAEMRIVACECGEAYDSRGYRLGGPTA